MFGVWQIPLTGRQTLEGWKKPGGGTAKPFPSPLIFKAMCALMRNLIHVFLIHLHVWGRCSETLRPKGLRSLFHPHTGEVPGFLSGEARRLNFPATQSWTPTGLEVLGGP